MKTVCTCFTACKPLSEMEREDYLDKINSLTSVIDQFKESYSLLKSSMESSEKRNEASEKRNEVLQSQVSVFKT